MLNELIGFFIDTGSGFVHKKHLRMPLNENKITINARAMQISCFCPREKFEPESSTLL